MRKTIIEAFGTLVGSVLHAEQSGDLTDHASHFAEALIDLFLGNFWFELEYAVVSDHDIVSF